MKNHTHRRQQRSDWMPLIFLLSLPPPRAPVQQLRWPKLLLDTNGITRREIAPRRWLFFWSVFGVTCLLLIPHCITNGVLCPRDFARLHIDFSTRRSAECKSSTSTCVHNWLFPFSGLCSAKRFRRYDDGHGVEGSDTYLVEFPPFFYRSIGSNRLICWRRMQAMLKKIIYYNSSVGW